MPASAMMSAGQISAIWTVWRPMVSSGFVVSLTPPTMHHVMRSVKRQGARYRARMDYSVRSGERADLITTLRQFAADRGRGSENERCADALAAARQLEQGADAAHFERVIYVVGESDRYSVVTGSREEVAKELMDAVEGWNHQGKVDLAVRAAQERVRVRSRGADVARVGHIVYVVRA
jgi:hypothetical protein